MLTPKLPLLARAAARTAGPLVVAALVLAGAWWTLNRPVDVHTVPATLRPVQEVLALRGQVHGAREAAVQAPRAGVLERVLVREGDSVRAGQLLGVLRSTLPEARVAEARAGADRARAELEQARRGPLPADVEQARAAEAHAAETAAARLEQAREELRLLEAGSRTEERDAARAALAEAQAREASAQLDLEREQRLARDEEQERSQLDRARTSAATARAALASAEAELAEAQRERQRNQELFDSKAVGRASLDNAVTRENVAASRLLQARAQAEETDREARREEGRFGANRGQPLLQARIAHDAARQATEAARARLRLLEAGPRSQELERARAAVRQAEADLRGARREGAARVKSLLSLPRPEDVRVAERRTVEASRALDAAGRDLAECEIRAPFAGIVSGHVAEPGEAVGGATPLLRLVGLDRLEIRVDTDERNLAQLHAGQAATVIPDALPERAFHVAVTRIGQRVDPDRGTVEVVLRPSTAGARSVPLRPLQTVSVNIAVGEPRPRVTVPTTALVNDGGDALYTVAGGRAVRRSVRLGMVNGGEAVILLGVEAGEAVVRDPAGLKPGARVRAAP